jgi:hypothetical protein
MKLESEINHLEQKIKENDAELALAKENLQKVQDGSEAHRINASKFQGELAHVKEQFIQQIAELKRLEEQNPGRETSDRLADSLQSMRSECRELQKHLESIRSENTQKIEAAMRGQQAIEGDLRQIDALENENERLKEKNAKLQKRFEGLNEAYNQQNALRNEHRDDRRSIGGLKNMAFIKPMEILPNQQTQYPRPLPAIPSSVEPDSVRTNNRVLDEYGAETPENALRKAAKGIGSIKPGSQFEKAIQTSSSKAVNPETPQIPNPEILTGTPLLNSPRTDSSSVSQHQRVGSGSRPLRIAARKHSIFGQSSRKEAGPHHLSHTETTEGVQVTYTSKDSLHYTDVIAAQTPLGITPFSQVAVNGPSPSPFTDLSSMMDELGPATNEEHIQEAYEKARSKKNEARITRTNVAEVGGLQAFAQRTMESLEEHEVVEANAVPKAQGPKKAPSVAEESLRRRTSQPSKSAIKKPMGANDAAANAAPKPVAFTITRSKTSVRSGSKALCQIQDGHRGSYNRAVSGSKPQTPTTGILPDAKKTPLGASNGTQQSPPMAVPKRNNSKRSAPSTAPSQQAAKRVRISTQRRVSFKSGDVIPDSQGSMQHA